MKKLFLIVALSLFVSSTGFAQTVSVGGKFGKQPNGKGGSVPFQQGQNGEIINLPGGGQYEQPALNNDIFSLSTAGATATAYVGAAAGTPLVAVMNPAGNKKAFVITQLCAGGRAAASAAGTVAFELWAGPSALPTGTVTAPRSQLTLQASGSNGIGFVNTAMTGSTALSYMLTATTYYWATAAGAFISPPACYPVDGLVIVVPGNMAAFGATSALTSATWGASMFWKEVDYP